MAVTKQKKVEILDKVNTALDGAQSVVFVNFKGLPVDETQAMRSKLRESGVSYAVAKKTLIKRALADKGYEGEQPSFDGELALAWGDDLVAPAREVQEYVKSTKDKVAILGGVFEGRYMSAGEMTEIASIPGERELRGMFVNVINSPIQGFAVVLSRIAETKS
jgi:large subunit ribosomal protein L10